LARRGYTQEIYVLMRTLIECTTHIEFVLDSETSEKHRTTVTKYIDDFFADCERNPHAEIRKAQIRQGKAHERLGETLDGFSEQYDESEDRRPAEALFSSSYRIFSNYVHAKYPEVMDLYGGKPGQFHVRGMSGTPKDGENLDTLATFAKTLSNTFVIMILGLNLDRLVKADPVVEAWYARQFDR